MRLPLFLLLVSLCGTYGFSQSWEELYQQSEEVWGEDWQENIAILEKARIAAQKEFGKTDSAYIQTISDLGLCHLELEQIDTAISLLQTALSLAGRHMDSNHPIHRDILNNLAMSFKHQGQYQEALPLFRQALKKAEQSLGTRHSEYGISLNNLAHLYQLMGKTETAFPLYQEAIAIIKQTIGDQSLNYGLLLNNFGFVLQELDRLEEAIIAHQDALNIVEHHLGKDHLHSFSLTNNLALLHKKLGNYEEALQLLHELLHRAEETLGKDHSRYGFYVNNLGGVYTDMGRYEMAATLLQEAIDNTIHNLGKEHPAYGSRLSNLAIVYIHLGRYEEALHLFQESQANTEKNLGMEHPHYIRGLNNLGEVHIALEQLDQASLYLQEALSLGKQFHGDLHSQLGHYLNNLGMLYNRMGNHQEAVSLLEEAVQNVGRNLGKQHANYGKYLTNLGNTYWHLGKDTIIRDLYQDLSGVLSEQLHTQFDVLNAVSQQSFLKTKQYQFDQISSFIYSHPEERELLEIGINQELLLKGFLQHSQADLLHSLRRHPDSLTHQLYMQWDTLHRVLARQYQKPIDQRLNSFDSLRARADELEISLVKLSLDFRQTRQQVRWQEVQRHLNNDEAAIEFSHFSYYDKGEKSSRILYLAYLITSKDTYPQMIPLFEEQELKQNLISSTSAHTPDQLYAYRGIQPQRSSLESNRLSDLLGKKLDTYLKGIRTLYFSPSGLLQRINLGAVPISPARLMGEKYHLVQLGSCRNLIFEADIPRTYSHKHALLFGGIQYDKDKQISLPFDVDTPLQGASSEMAMLASRSYPHLLHWTHLKETKSEIEHIGQLLQANAYEPQLKYGTEASEESFKHMKVSPRILHIASHGYFFPDPTDTTRYDLGRQTLLQSSEHPMIRSGLILAGANHAWAGNPVPEGQEDGILTAYEISRMDLSHTELVVLSACETGLGDIEGNEGVYGLQRAFKIAGAKYILMSLWQVPDKATQELMTVFYEKWLGGMEIRSALQEAQKQMRKKYKEPYYWAGFVLVE